jgi:hypothetical protein
MESRRKNFGGYEEMAKRDKLRDKQQGGHANAGPPLTMSGFMEDITTDTPFASTPSPEVDERLEELESEIQQAYTVINNLTAERDHALAVLHSGGIVHFGRCELTPTGLLMPEDLGLDEWLEIGKQFNAIESAMQWLIGDWAVKGEDNSDLWLEGTQSDKQERNLRYQALVESTGYKHGSVKNLASIARNIPYDERRSSVHYSKHVAVAGLPVAKMRELLDFAEANPTVSVREFREKVMRAKGIKLPSPLPFAKDTRKSSFNKIMKSLKKGERPDANDIEALRAWLDEIENDL